MSEMLDNPIVFVTNAPAGLIFTSSLVIGVVTFTNVF